MVISNLRLYLVYLDNGKISIIHAKNISQALIAFYGEDVGGVQKKDSNEFTSYDGDVFHDMGVVTENQVLRLNTTK